MKTKLFLFIAFLGVISVNAKEISVVSPSGTTTLYETLDQAIQNAQSGSTLYLSGGGFIMTDSIKIKKKLTIIGIGHHTKNDNADGNTIVQGNICFESGADNSAVMGIYLAGNINIGTAENAVKNVLIRYCNINSVQVLNSGCLELVVNQNYVRNNATFGNADTKITNNVIHSISNVNGGEIKNNLIRHYHPYHFLTNINHSIIKNNINCECYGGNTISGSNNTIDNNMGEAYSYGDNYKIVSNTEMFENLSGITSLGNFHLKEGCIGINAGTDGKDIGIYGGTGFSDSALPPIPRIVSKSIPEQTDENGKLKIQIRVKAQ